MEVLKFTDPREVAAYWDTFEDRSIRPIQPYLWTWPEDEARDEERNATITRINRNELDWMVLDKNQQIRMDAATWVVHQNTPKFQNVLIVTHEQLAGSEYAWDLKILDGIYNKTEAENLAKQILGESALAFRVVE